MGRGTCSHDLKDNGGWPSQVDASGFELGVNMAVTPGQVVYRSRLIELIQYEPQTPEVHETPLLFCPAWINKYYISDLAPGKSLIEWAVQHGQACFAISYRNPDESLRDLTFEDYWLEGPADAVRVIKKITGSPQVNTISVCLGGTLTAIGMAKNAADRDTSIKSSTFLNTHTDFSIPGMLGVFTDESTIAGLERKMEKHGYLDGDKMAHTFDALRASDLVFHYVGNNWLQGKKPPAFDLLVWNKDSTRMPAKMHSRYLRSCFLRNEFSRGASNSTVRSSILRRSPPRSMFSRPSRITLSLGNPRSRPPTSSVARHASSCRMRGILLESSTLLIRSAVTGWPTESCPTIRTSGGSGRPPTKEHGGRTGPVGSPSRVGHPTRSHESRK